MTTTNTLLCFKILNPKLILQLPTKYKRLFPNLETFNSVLYLWLWIQLVFHLNWETSIVFHLNHNQKQTISQKRRSENLELWNYYIPNNELWSLFLAVPGPINDPCNIHKWTERLSTHSWALITLFFYKNSFIRTRASYLTKS